MTGRSAVDNPALLSVDQRLQDVAFGLARLDWLDAHAIGISGDGAGASVFDVKARSDDSTINADGTDSGSPPAVETFYYVYWDLAADSLVLCLEAPTQQNDGSFRLGTNASTIAKFLLVGWVQTIDDGTAHAGFVDSDSARLVASYYNRQRKRLFTCPAYSDNNAKTTYAKGAAAAFDYIHAGAGDFVRYITNGEDCAEMTAVFTADAALAGVVQVGISDNADKSPSVIAGMPNLELAGSSVSCSMRDAIAAPSLKKAELLYFGAAITFVADYARNGAVADPAATYLVGSVMS